MNSTIALFPLHIVVFPGSSYPLHIFEERYKKLIKKCLADNDGFGIIAFIEKTISRIGSFVNIEKVLKEYTDGKYDIVVKGIERYYTLSNFMHPDGYLLAEIESYNDNSSQYDVELYNLVLRKFIEILKKVSVTLDASYFNNLKNAKFKSFKIAEKSGLKIDQQQHILTLKNENNRLYFLKEHLEKISQYIDENKIVKNIILGDGYIN